MFIMFFSMYYVSLLNLLCVHRVLYVSGVTTESLVCYHVFFVSRDTTESLVC